MKRNTSFLYIFIVEFDHLFNFLCCFCWHGHRVPLLSCLSFCSLERLYKLSLLRSPLFYLYNNFLMWNVEKQWNNPCFDKTLGWYLSMSASCIEINGVIISYQWETPFAVSSSCILVLLSSLSVVIWECSGGPQEVFARPLWSLSLSSPRLSAPLQK